VDPRQLGLARYDAGERFLSAVKSLGLNPTALFWAYDARDDEFVLVLVSNFFDFAGPLKLMRLLTTAHSNAALPPEISPFMLRVHSPRQRIFHELKLHLKTWVGEKGVEKPDFDRSVIAGDREPFANVEFSYGDLVGNGAWIYQLASDKAAPAATAEREWSRFDRNVRSLAA
jgi:hypothetical protein